jgi:hypothetical protein
MEQAIEYSLSDTDIKNLLGGNIKITSYPDLAENHSIDELFDSRGRAILFFPQENEQNGHWTALIKDGRQIEFFDPYGEPPEAQKDTLSDSKLEQMRMKQPLLAKLLDESRYRIIFNKVQLQELDNDVHTCGRHCVCRLLHYKEAIQRYRDLIRRSGMTPDEFVVKETFRDLGK